MPLPPPGRQPVSLPPPGRQPVSLPPPGRQPVSLPPPGRQATVHVPLPSGRQACKHPPLGRKAMLARLVWCNVLVYWEELLPVGKGPISVSSLVALQFVWSW